MKNKLIILFILAFSIVSCNDDYLERFPLDELSSQTFWKNEKDLQVYTSILYTYVPDHGFLWDDEVSDNQAPSKYDEMAAGTHIPSVETWDWTYLRKCNYFLENYNKVDIAQETKDVYAGEVRFFRAWFYSDMVIDYGDVPYTDKTLSISDEDILYGPRTPRNGVMDKVIEDLDYAIEHLPEENTLGRINKYIALHLKARICLFEGAFRKYHKLGESKHLFQKAAEAANTIISSGKYEIYKTGKPNKDYENLWLQDDLKGNKEMILFKQYDNVQVSHPEYFARSITNHNSGLTKDMVEDYLCTDGKPIGLSSVYSGDETFEKEVKNRDPRLLQTIVPPGSGWFIGDDLWTEVNPRLIVALGGWGSASSTGYHWRTSYNEKAVDAYYKAETDAPVFRYAETLLIYAEAKAELGECSQADIDKSINLLRDRVGMPNMVITDLERDPDSDMTIAAGYLEEEVPVLLEEIRRERRVELGCEGFRRNDLLRWRAGKFYEKTVLGAKWSYFLGLKDVDGNALYSSESLGKDIWINAEGFIEPYQFTLPQGRKFDSEKHYFLPIPIIELSLNPALKQNPNW